MKYYYDVVLSFAGEDREYVEECADIYSNKAKYAIVFVSQYYVKKRWTIGTKLVTILLDEKTENPDVLAKNSNLWSNLFKEVYIYAYM